MEAGTRLVAYTKQSGLTEPMRSFMARNQRPEESMLIRCFIVIGQIEIFADLQHERDHQP